MENYNCRRIESINELITIAITYTAYWYRGHSTVVNKLIPKVFRGGLDESTIVIDYMKYHKAVQDAVLNSPIEHLFLMQHHGIPTRLLDWTQNILVAAFFAVIDDQDKDGELWALNPIGLKDYAQKNGTDIGALTYFLVNEPFIEDRSTLPNFNAHNLHPYFINPPYANKRMNPQRSVFTVHPFTVKEENMLPGILDNVNLDRLIIPKENKPKLQEALYHIGISHVTLFPDLDGLAKEVVVNHRRKKHFRFKDSITEFLDRMDNLSDGIE